MRGQVTFSQPEQKPPLEGLAFRAFWVFFGLMATSLVIYFVGLIYGEAFADAGHSAKRDRHEIVIGNDVYSVPENMIRYAEARTSGITGQLQLYMHWPTRDGYSREQANAFNEQNPDAMQVAFFNISQRSSILDMRDRLDAVYAKAIEGEPKDIFNGLKVSKLKASLGFVDEVLVYAPSRTGKPHFVARCITSAEETVLAACETEFFSGQTSQIRVRFPAHFLKSWRSLTTEFETVIANFRAEA
ncbi:MAG: hypothetical protein AAGI92_11205 [Pseudomonadota bacterium]